MPSCSACKHLNPDGARFCSQCGASLERTCANCNARLDSTALFCPSCGTRLAPKEKESRTAEHRYTSVIFSDLAGSSRLAEQLDAESFHEVIGAYHDLVSRAVERYEGHVAKYLGDGAIVFFGYPVAHEDDCKRSILAGLAIIESLTELNDRLEARHGIRIAIRVGIHAGSVIAGEMGSADRPVLDIVGETPNIAARLQELAEPNTVVVSSATQRPTEFNFRFEYLGEKSLKGVSRPLGVFKVLSVAENRVQNQPMVGRSQDLDQLWNQWTKVKQGNGRLAIIRGEAGIGKSTLVNTILTKCRQDVVPAEVEHLRCSPYHQTTPFFPIVEHLRAALMHLVHTDSADVQLDRLVGFITSRGLSPEETVPILAPLLSIPFEERFASPVLSPEGRRIRTMELMVEMLSKRTADQPIVLVLDNVHWADPSTLETLDKVLGSLQALRIYVIVTSRPHYAVSILRPPGSLEITLDKLDNEAICSLARQVAGGKDLPEEILRRIVERTDGIPLFAEELTKTIIESGAVRLEGDRYELVGPLLDLSIPTTLQGSLMARLERVSGRKDIAQVAAVVGREFSPGVIAAVMNEDEYAVSRQLANLVSADLVYQVESFSGRRAYRFRHALIQDAAYDSLLRSVRKRYHEDIARTLESQFADLAEEQPEVIANHYSAAGAVEAALHWWPKAGQRALSRSANVEAISHFTSGLELLEQLAESPEKVQSELAMLAQRGMALIATKGFAAPEVGESFSRAEQICQIIGETPLLFPVIWGLWVFSLVRSDLEESIEHADHMLRLAAISGDSGMAIEAHFAKGDSLFWLGNLEESREHLDKAVALYEPEVHRANILLYGQDPGVTTLCYSAYTYWCLGYPDRALEYANRAMEVAEATKHSFSIGWGLAFACTLRNWRGEFEEARGWAEKCSQYCTAQGQAFWASASIASLGWAEFYSSDRELGLSHLRQGLEGYEMTGSIVVTPLWRAIYAEALYESGRLEVAMKVCDQGLGTVESCHEWVTEPYLRTVRGRILAQRGDRDAAVSELRQAFELAESQSSKMRSLLAAAALLEIDPTPAHFERLSRTYAWFTEGFETLHLVAAKRLLDSYPAMSESPSP